MLNHEQASYGQVLFESTSHGSSGLKPASYACMSENTEMKDVVAMLLKCWKLSPPSVLFTVTGSAQAHCAPSLPPSPVSPRVRINTHLFSADLHVFGAKLLNACPKHFGPHRTCSSGRTKRCSSCEASKVLRVQLARGYSLAARIPVGRRPSTAVSWHF